MERVRGTGPTIFAAVLLAIGGVLNAQFGIARLGNSSFFVADAHYIFGSLHAWGWVSLILGILELVAALSIFQGGAFGRYFAIFVGALVAIGELVEHPRAPVLVHRRICLDPVDHLGADDDHRAGTGELTRTRERELEGGSSRWNR